MVTFIKEGSEEAEKINADHILIIEREKRKLLPGDIVKMMQVNGFVKFNMHHFVQCWKSNNARRDNTYGVWVVKTWYWYENFIPVVEQYCNSNNLK